MSRLGKRPIKVNDGINVKIDDGSITLSSNKGERTIDFPDVISISQDGQNLIVNRTGDKNFEKSQHGLISRLVLGAIEDLTNGVKRELTFKGTGYRAKAEGDKLTLTMGYSHDIDLAIPEGVAVNIVKNSINIEGSNRVIVGEFAAKVREIRPPEVYKGKGIKYKEETIRRKAGKTAQSAGKAA